MKFSYLKESFNDEKVFKKNHIMSRTPRGHMTWCAHCDANMGGEVGICSVCHNRFSVKRRNKGFNK